MRKALLWLGIGWLALSAPAAENPLQIELVSAVESIQPGQPFEVGLHLQHPPTYHTYWKFSGIVGLPTGFAWKLPEGWTAEPIQWPAPQRVMMYQIKAQGFEGEQLLPMRLTPPASLVAGQKVVLAGKASWMCCGPLCHPGFQDLSLELPVVAAGAPTASRWTTLFAQSAASIARPCPDWEVRAERQASHVRLHIRPLSKPAHSHFAQIQTVTFFTDDGLTDPNQGESFTRTESELIVSQVVSEFAPQPWPGSVHGTLRAENGWLPGGLPASIAIDALWAPAEN